MKKLLLYLFVFSFLLSSVSALGVGSITLVDSSTNKIISEYANLQEDTTVYFEDLPSRINVVANLHDGTGSAKFYLNEQHVRTENSFPFSMFGDFFGNYYSWRPNAQSYLVRVDPYSSNGGRGSQGDSFEIVLRFMNQPPAQAPPPNDAPGDDNDDSGDSDDQGDDADSGDDQNDGGQDDGSDDSSNDQGNDGGSDDDSGSGDSNNNGNNQDDSGNQDSGSDQNDDPVNFDENIVVSDVEIIEIDGDSFVVGWETSRTTSGVVLYGTTSALGDSTGTGIYSNQNARTQHQVQVTGLSEGTVYFYRLEGVDQNNNAYQSRIYLTRTPGTTSGNGDDNSGSDGGDDTGDDTNGQVTCPSNRPDPLSCGTSGPSVCGFDGTDEFTYANACSACSDTIIDYYETGDCQNEGLPGDDTPDDSGDDGSDTDNPGTNPPETACPNPRPDPTTCGTTGAVVCGLGIDGIDLTYANACTACVDTLVDSYHVGSCSNESLPGYDSSDDDSDGGNDDGNQGDSGNYDFGITNFCIAKAGWNPDGTCEQVIQNNMQINLNSIDYDFSILANGFGDELDSVMFFINGVHYNTEHVFPWSLNDDVLYFDIQKWEPQAGTYTLRAESYDTQFDKALAVGQGTQGQSASVTFTIIDDNAAPPADTPDDPPSDNNPPTDNPGTNPPEIACPNPRPDASTCGTTGNVVCGLGIDGIDLTYANACTACVDTLVDSYHVGSCVNEGTPSTGDNGGSVDTSFSVTGFYLTKEDNNPIRELSDGDTIYADEYDADVRIAARTNGNADSVIFYQRGAYVNTEKGAPFTLFGSMQNFDYYGAQTIRARVYDIDCEYDTDVCSGNEGVGKTIDLNIQRTNDGSNTLNLAAYGITLSSTSPLDASATSDGILIDRQNVGSVAFTTALNGLAGLDIDDAITIENARITVDDTTYPQLDGEACLTFENLGFSNPRVLKDGSTYTGYDSFSYTGGTLRFCVDGFSTYTIVEGSSSPPSNTPGQNDLGIDTYFLVNTNNNERIRELTSGQIIDLADYNHPISIVAEGYGPIESTIVFIATGNQQLAYTRTENLAPWSINGDTNTVDVNPWYPSEGTYVIQFHPYTEDSDKTLGANGGRGTLGTVGSIILDIRNSGPDTNPVPQSNIVSTRNLNPQTTSITPSSLPAPNIEVRSRSGSRVSPDGKSLAIPSGFQINVFNKDISQPRWPYVGPNGDVFVTDRSTNNIILLRDNDNDGVAEFRRTFATPGSNSLNRPLGMAIHNGYFYVANTGDVRRYSYTVGQESLNGRGTKLADLPYLGQNNHWTRNLIIHPNGQKMYVSVGSAGNAQVESLPRASVIEMNLDGSNQQTFAYGLRNPVGMDFHPNSNELYVSVMERDQLGNNLPPDFATRIRRGEFFGYPYTYITADRRDTRVPVNNAEAAKTVTPDILIEAHSTPLGIAFYEGNTFPSKYRNGMFFTQRGSWNRDPLSGYKISFAPFGSNNRPTGSYEEFITGFQLPGSNNIMGRPTGITNLPDGSLLISDDYNGRMYRVQYVG